ncbi:MAG: RHS repeat domain-containing protein, partial [Planctomycetota bacterium]
TIVDQGQGNLNITTDYNYDAVGNLTSIIDPNSSIIYYDYDNANRKTAEYFAATSGTTKQNAKLKKQTGYYENNQIKDVNSYDYDGSTLLEQSRFQYDARGRLTQVTQDINDVSQAVTVYDYSDSGFEVGGVKYQIRITDADNKQTHIALDGFGRRIETLYPSSDYECLEYNGDGTLAAKTVFDTGDTEQWIDYNYDGYGRLTGVDYPDDGYISYIYDGFGRKILDQDGRNSSDNIGGTGEIAYDYDVLGRITSVTDQNNYEITYTYTADNQKKTIKVYDDEDDTIYSVEYLYDDALRLETITEPLLGTNDYITQFEYDDNGNRTQLKHYLTGNPQGNTVYIDYTYNACECKCDNLLTEFSTTGGPEFSFDATDDNDIDGLQRLRDASETLTKVGGGTVTHSCTYEYDMLSRLTYAKATNLFGAPNTDLEYTHTFDKAGNITDFTYNKGQGEQTEIYDFNGNLVTGIHDGNDINWDLNGRQTSQLSDVPANYVLEYDWDGRLRKGQDGSSSKTMEARYTPDGMRVRKLRNWDDASDYNYRYIIDMVGKVPTVLLVLDANDNDTILTKYIHANGQVLAQHDSTDNDEIYFYLHDRLGSVRQVINTDALVVNCYTYDPWGIPVGEETEETISNLYLFAGYVWDEEISQYYCYKRQYDPVLFRFTSRDPVEGSFKEPLNLHMYLYCNDDPINRTDPTGELWGVVRKTYRTVHGISAYYTGLAVGLQHSRNPWDVMDVAIAANTFRQTYFDLENLNKPFAWELAMRDQISQVYDKISNACDWGGLGGCLGWEGLEHGIGYAVGKWKLDALGVSACLACVSPEPVVSKVLGCSGCAVYLGYKGYSFVDTIKDVKSCFTKHCGQE